MEWLFSKRLKGIVLGVWQRAGAVPVAVKVIGLIVLPLLLAAIVLGPRRVAESARELGKLVRNLRNYFKELSSDLSRELDLLADLKEVSRDTKG